MHLVQNKSGRHAVSKVNFDKIECILPGTLKDQYETVEGINASKHVVSVQAYISRTQKNIMLYHKLTI